MAKPVWGVGDPEPYDSTLLNTRLGALRDGLLSPPILLRLCSRS